METVSSFAANAVVKRAARRNASCSILLEVARARQMKSVMSDFLASDIAELDTKSAVCTALAPAWTNNLQDGKHCAAAAAAKGVKLAYVVQRWLTFAPCSINIF